MPELPEVETIKRQLEKMLIGKKIASVEVFLPKLIQGISTPTFKQKIEKIIIKNIWRRAKILIISLSNNFSLLIHLKMTGQLIYHKIYNIKQKTKYTHIIYHFIDKSVLLHNDLRQFGYVKLINTDKVNALLENKEKLGPEPLDKNFTLEKFKQLLQKRKTTKIKTLLMDQKFIAGIGNIYSDEILFFAKIRPARPVSALKQDEIKKIYQGIKKILTEAIKLRGSSVENYIDASGKSGEYAQKIKVYGRKGESCPKCKTKIERLKMAGRSAHFCPKCQG